MNSCIAAVDAGTGGVRCVIYDGVGNAISQNYCEMKTVYTSDGRAEQNPEELVKSAFEAVRGAVMRGGVDPEAILGVSFAGTQTTFVPVDREGNYLSNIILWQDMRGMEVFPEIRERMAEHHMSEADLYRHTLKPLDTLLAGAKLVWMGRHEPGVYDRIYTVINPQSVLLRAFGAEEYTVDVTDVGWMLAHDGATLEADPELIEVFGLDPALFPKICAPGDLVGEVTTAVAEKTGLRPGTPLFQGAVDQCCAALAAGNYGTADLATMCMGTAGVIMTYSEEPMPDPRCRYYVIRYPTGGFANEFAVPVAASAFRWVRDMLYPAEVFDHRGIYRRMDGEAAQSSIGAGGVAFLPQMAGSIYPRMDTMMRGGFVGASLSTTRADLVRAALEGIAYEMRQILEASESQFGTLRLLGGGARSDIWNQMQADVYNCPVETIVTEEASALGAAMIAATGAGMYSSLKDAVRGMSSIRRRYDPDPARTARYDESYRAWLHCAEDLGMRAFPALAEVRNHQG